MFCGWYVLQLLYISGTGGCPCAGVDSANQTLFVFGTHVGEVVLVWQPDENVSLVESTVLFLVRLAVPAHVYQDAQVRCTPDSKGTAGVTSGALTMLCSKLPTSVDAVGEKYILQAAYNAYAPPGEGGCMRLCCSVGHEAWPACAATPFPQAH